MVRYLSSVLKGLGLGLGLGLEYSIIPPSRVRVRANPPRVCPLTHYPCQWNTFHWHVTCQGLDFYGKRYFDPAKSVDLLSSLISAAQVLTEGDGRVRVETTKGHCVFTIECAERQDEGVYSVVVRNPAGEDTADINVKVVGENGDYK